MATDTLKFIVLAAIALSYVSDSASALTTTLNIANNNIAPDGFNRVATLANGVFPAPVLSGNIGDNFQITVNNQLTDDTLDLVTSIHWHGLFQHTTNWADGPAFVNQCPIIPNESFLYDFNVPDQSGTYWYHSHYALQYCDGLRGPLVIYDPNDPLLNLYDFDDETTIITLSDWYHLPASQVPPPPNSNPITLINGLGRSPSDLTTNLAVINVQAGKRYRFRLISMSCEPFFTFSIDGHSLTVIEADGVETESLTVDSITIYASQRYSFILNANQTVDNYWIRALPNLGNGTFIGGQNSAILRYAGAPDAEPTTEQTASVSPLQETDLHPLNPVPVPGGDSPGDVDQAYSLEIGFSNGQFTINNTPFESPNVPILLQILSGTSTAQDLMPSGSIYSIPGNNSSIELTFNGGSLAAPHPIHIHGHNFHVIRSAGSSTYNYDNPVIRDTVNTGTSTSDVTVVRILADNPGPWFLHCHIDFHLNAGLAAVLAEDVADVASTNPVPQAWSNLCPAYNNYIGQ